MKTDNVLNESSLIENNFWLIVCQAERFLRWYETKFIKLHPIGQIWHTAYFLRYSFVGTQPCAFIYSFFHVITTVLVVVTKTIFPPKLKILTVLVCPFTENVSS